MDDKRYQNPLESEGQLKRRPFERGPEKGVHTDRPYGRSPGQRGMGSSPRFGRDSSQSRPHSRFGSEGRTEDDRTNRRGAFPDRKSPRNFPLRDSKGRHLVGEEPIKKPKIVSDNQITEGNFMGKRISTVDLPKFKVTSRRLREVFFRILGRKIRGRRLLDLRCGVGTMGIEALSRGAGLVTFVDRSARMIEHTKKNLETFEIKQGHTEVVELEALPFLKRMEKAKRKWDVLFVGIPQADDSEELFAYFKRGVTLTKGSALVLEHASSVSLPERTGRLRRRKIVVQGDVTMTFYEFR